MSGTGGRRADVLAVLRHHDGTLSIASIAERIDVHVNTVRFHLDTLLASGQVERVTATHDKPGRPPQLFAATRGMDPGGSRDYRLLAEALADGMAQGADPAIRASAAGRALGAKLGGRRRSAAQHEPIAQLVDLLDELGFAPERRAGDQQIGLRHCPFLELAQSRADVVCPVHLGLMQGAVETWDVPIRVERLTPFVEPDLCVAQLSGVPR